jgi:hypothetical protein
MLHSFPHLLQIRPELQQLHATIQEMGRETIALHGVFREVVDVQEDHSRDVLHQQNGSLLLHHLHLRPLAR